MVERERLLLPDAELSRPALVLAQRFVQRWDPPARQLEDGSYVCVHEQLNVGHLFGYLRGEIPLGAYLLDQESWTRFLVLDVDDEQDWERLGHLWLFLAQAVAGRQARAFGQGLLEAHKVKGVELFPKQDQIADGPGYLIRMPFGVHRLTGRRYGFYTADGSPFAPTIREQVFTLGASEAVPEAALEANRSFVPPEPTPAVREPPDELAGTVSEGIKTRVTVL
jgi:hypothetical protein